MVWSLAYSSTPLIAAHSVEMLDIARVALRRNAARDVSGVLYFSDAAFFQVLEGAEADVEAIYESIRRDPRHEELTLLARGAVPARRFGGWAMRFCDASDNPHLRGLLERRPVTPEDISTTVQKRIEALLAP